MIVLSDNVGEEYVGRIGNFILRRENRIEAYTGRLIKADNFHYTIKIIKNGRETDTETSLLRSEILKIEWADINHEEDESDTR